MEPDWIDFFEIIKAISISALSRVSLCCFEVKLLFTLIPLSMQGFLRFNENHGHPLIRLRIPY